MKFSELLEVKVDLAHIANQVFDAFKRSPEAKWVRQSSPPEKESGGGYRMEMRDWGTWQNPSDASDEEDYDWQELSPKSYKVAKDMCVALSKTFKVKVSCGTGEKNYFEIFVEQK